MREILEEIWKKEINMFGVCFDIGKEKVGCW